MPHSTNKVILPESWDDPRSLACSFSTFRGGTSTANGTTKGELSPPHSDTTVKTVVPASNGIGVAHFNGTKDSNGIVTNASDNGSDVIPSSEELLVDVVITLGPGHRRFGFSVIGGSDVGCLPCIENITPRSPADRADLEVGDEILEVNGKSLEDCTHTEVISHIHQCIRSRTICLRVKRKSGNKLALDLVQNSNVQDAFVIAVEQQARERLERLSALKKIKPVDMTKLSQELNEGRDSSSTDLNGVLEGNSIYVTSVPELQNSTLERLKRNKAAQLSEGSALAVSGDSAQPGSGVGGGTKESIGANGHSELFSADDEGHDQELELTQEILESKPPDKSLAKPRGETGDADVEKCDTTKDSEQVVVVERSPRETDYIPRREVSVDYVTPHLTPESKFHPEVSAKRQVSSAQENVPAMMELEHGPHREMAVDVPDSFVGVTKTPPRYPPPKPTGGSVDSLLRKKGGVPEPPVRTTSGVSAVTTTTTWDANKVIPTKGVDSVAKPAIAPKPHVNGRTSSQKAVSKPQPNGVTVADSETSKRIRKYQEDIRKRKEEEERLAREEEFLRSSLRGSKKLQALESNPPPPPRSGIENTAFQLEEGDTGTLPVGHKAGRLVADIVDGEGREAPELQRIVDAWELLQSLNRIQSHLKENGQNAEELSLVERLLQSGDFKKVLNVHNKVQETWCFDSPPVPVCSDSQDLAQEVINSLQECSLPEAAELLDILSKFEIEGLMYSHDKIAERQAIPAMTPDEELLDRASQYTEESVKIIRIDKTNEPLGATVRNEGESVIVGRIVKGGAAEKSGLLHEGDEILEVNGIEMRGKSVNEVCDILATMMGTLTFLIIPSQYERPKGTNRDVVVHVKAHFDYDPDDDLYIPCRELGISFQKGDILHVINQEDPNWWQAYREGEEDQTLAGLIPSKSFQQQREAMKQTIVGDTNNKEKSRKAKFLCAKKHHKKKKKKVLYNANYNEDFDADQILTYEEVALYYPRANRKRPVVLIGPTNIGRHELRQRLMEDTERFAAAVPHTSRSQRDGEVNGVDYHFITRAQFEADIVGGKFVEHGEYEKNYYGTSLDAIRAVVNSGKICVLNLHPQSLKILKYSDLKPYVVFVAPPSLEKLRQNRAKMGASVKDEELKNIIEEAREMEENYGHFFDLIIINSDIDKAFNELLKETNILEREPQWVPAIWLKSEMN